MAREPEFKILRTPTANITGTLRPPAAGLPRSGQAYTIKQACVNEVYWIKDKASQIMIYDHTGE